MFAAAGDEIVWNVFIQEEMAHQGFFVCEVAVFFHANLANLRRRAGLQGIYGFETHQAQNIAVMCR